ncbi:hypothetical protein ACE6H2_006436 [Prunus campanulata]
MDYLSLEELEIYDGCPDLFSLLETKFLFVFLFDTMPFPIEKLFRVRERMKAVAENIGLRSLQGDCGEVCQLTLVISKKKKFGF